MSRENDKQIVKLQYSSQNNLNARQALHRDWSTNKYGWEKWVYDHYNLKAGYKVIEFGCGNGGIWERNLERVPENVDILLTDMSEGMLEAAKKTMEGSNKEFSFKIMDVQEPDAVNNSYDRVIANHMLYHVPDRRKAISQIARILKDDGVFVATTNSVNSMSGMKELVTDFSSKVNYNFYSVAEKFGMENGKEQLEEYFGLVERDVYEDSIHLTKAQPLIDYVMSMEGHINVHEVFTVEKLKEFKEYLEEIIKRDGSIEFPKRNGMFICRKPIRKD